MADPSGSDQSSRLGVHPVFVLGVVLALALLDFILQNRDDVGIHFLFFYTTQPLWLLLLITSALAIAAGEVFGFVLRRRRD